MLPPPFGPNACLMLLVAISFRIRPNGTAVKTDQNEERLPPSELGTAPVLLSPFRARAAHVVQFGPVRVEQSGPEPAPPLGRHVEAAARRREQHSRHVRI